MPLATIHGFVQGKKMSRLGCNFVNYTSLTPPVSHFLFFVFFWLVFLFIIFQTLIKWLFSRYQYQNLDFISTIFFLFSLASTNMLWVDKIQKIYQINSASFLVAPPKFTHVCTDDDVSKMHSAPMKLLRMIHFGGWKLGCMKSHCD